MATTTREGWSARIQEALASAPPDAKLVGLELHKIFPLTRSPIDALLGRPERAVRAVDGVDFYIRDKETLALVGESGCGKTTIGRLVTGLLELTHGAMLCKLRSETVEKIRANQPDIGVDDGFIDLSLLGRPALKEARRELATVFQDPYSAFDPRYTVKGILEEPLAIHRVPQEERATRIRSVLEEVRLMPVEDFMWRHPHMLSGGQRQRLGVARSLILDPTLVVADEPVSMLDVSIRAEILELLMEERARRSIAYLFITHDLAVARYISDRVAVMYLGRIVEEGPSKRVIENPAHPYTKALVAAIPEPDPDSRMRPKEVPIRGEVPSALNIPAGCRFHPRCPYAFDRCRVNDPPMVEVEPNHRAACWLLPQPA